MPAERRRLAPLAVAIAAVVLFAGATVVGLRWRPTTPDTVQLYLVPGAGERDLLAVYTTVLGTANHGRLGFTLLDGIAGVTLTGDVEQSILVVRFRDGLPRGRRQELIAAFRASPRVIRVEPAVP